MIRQQIFDQPPFIPIFEDYQPLKNKNIGVTGANGVLGSIISKRLKDHNIRMTPYGGDITETELLHNWFVKHNFDYFFHFAAIVPVTEVQNDPLRAYEVNAIGSYNICKEIIKTQSSCRFFLASSSHVYKNQPAENFSPLEENSPKEPKTIYGMTKLVAEQVSIPILEQYKISYCLGRIFSFTSSIQEESYLVPALARRIEDTPENGVLNIINADCVRDIIDAETVIDCVLHLAVSNFVGVVNIGSGVGTRIIDIAGHIAKQARKKIQFKSDNKIIPDSLIANVALLKKILSQ